MGVNLPFVESSNLTTTRKIVPHTTLPNREKAGSVGDQGKTRGKEEEELWKNTE
jgi:hypothetical protein